MKEQTVDLCSRYCLPATIFSTMYPPTRQGRRISYRKWSISHKPVFDGTKPHKLEAPTSPPPETAPGAAEAGASEAAVKTEGCVWVCVCARACMRALRGGGAGGGGAPVSGRAS